MIQKIISTLRTAGLPEEEYNGIRLELWEANRRLLFSFSSIMTVAMGVMFLVSPINEALSELSYVYLIVALIGLVMTILSQTFLKKSMTGTMIGSVVVIASLQIFGIVVGTIIDPVNPTVSFVVLQFVIAFLFIMRPFWVAVLILIGEVVYITIALRTQTPEMLSYNLGNIIPYGLTSIVVGTYMAQIRVRSVYLSKVNEYLSVFDPLTGLSNRTSYEMVIHADEQRKGNDANAKPIVMACSCDINGLKQVNDAYGHRAGDQLIREVAEVLKTALGPYGTCYRMGGDEFVALLEEGCPEEEQLLKIIRAEEQKIQEKYGCAVLVSVGFQKICEGAGDNGETGNWGKRIGDAVHKADLEMYQAKAEYYKKEENNRREE